MMMMMTLTCLWAGAKHCVPGTVLLCNHRPSQASDQKQEDIFPFLYIMQVKGEGCILMVKNVIGPYYHRHSDPHLYTDISNLAPPGQAHKYVCICMYGGSNVQIYSSLCNMSTEHIKNINHTELY